MTKLTGGPGWALVPENAGVPPPRSAGAPRPAVRLERRSGKQVTVIAGLHTFGTQRLEDMARALKTRCGAGGTVKNGAIEIQGDRVALVRAWLKEQGI